MTHRKRPHAQRRWVKHLYRSHDTGEGETSFEPKNRVLRAGLSVLRKITDRVLPLAATQKFEQVTAKVVHLRDELRHKRDALRAKLEAKLDAVTSLIKRPSADASASSSAPA